MSKISKKQDAKLERLSQDIATSCVAGQVRKISRGVSQVYDEALRPFGLKVSQVNVLVAVSLLGPARPSDLQAALLLEKSTLSRTFERMRSKGWLESVATKDARAHELVLTKAGQELLLALHPAWKKAQRKVEQLLGQHTVVALASASTRFQGS